MMVRKSVAGANLRVRAKTGMGQCLVEGVDKVVVTKMNLSIECLG